jgi:hypothetical protein
MNYTMLAGPQYLPAGSWGTMIAAIVKMFGVLYLAIVISTLSSQCQLALI